MSVTRTGTAEEVRVVAVRTVETPARGAGGASEKVGGEFGGVGGEEGVWMPPKRGMKREVVKRVMRTICEKGGVGEEVLDGLEGLDEG